VKLVTYFDDFVFTIVSMILISLGTDSHCHNK
jgi:hypothetical protein